MAQYIPIEQPEGSLLVDGPAEDVPSEDDRRDAQGRAAEGTGIHGAIMCYTLHSIDRPIYYVDR